jgi:hypothetical protein
MLMSIVTKLAVLSLATALGSPATRSNVDFTSPNDGQRINQLWLVTYLDPTGLETVAQAKLTSGEYAPLIAADPARLKSMMPAAIELAKAQKIKMRLIKLTERQDIEEISP